MVTGRARKWHSCHRPQHLQSADEGPPAQTGLSDPAAACCRPLGNRQWPVCGVHWGEQAVARCPGEEDRQQTPAERLKANGIPVLESADRLLREICPVATCLVAVRSGVDEIDATRSGVDIRKGE